MKRVTLTNKTHYLITDAQQAALLQAIDKDAKYVILHGDVLMVNSIIGIQDEAIFEELEHLKNHEYKCVHGKWHGKDDRCYGHDAPLPQRADTSLYLEADNRTEEERYLAARAKADEVRKNYQTLKGTKNDTPTPF